MMNCTILRKTNEIRMGNNHYCRRLLSLGFAEENARSKMKQKAAEDEVFMCHGNKFLRTSVDRIVSNRCRMLGKFSGGRRTRISTSIQLRYNYECIGA